MCRPGFFKASPHSQSCSKCPPHSYTHEEASTSCVCEKDYFRRDSDPPTMACTSKETYEYLVMLIFTSKEKHDGACFRFLTLSIKAGIEFTFTIIALSQQIFISLKKHWNMNLFYHSLAQAFIYSNFKFNI